MKALDAIQKKYNEIAETVENLAGSRDEILYRDHVGILLRLLTPRPADTPPDTPRRVLVAQCGMWHIGQYKHTTPPYKRQLWHVAGVSTVEMLEWLELPKVTK